MERDSLWAKEVRDQHGTLVGHIVFCNSRCTSEGTKITIDGLRAGVAKNIYPYDSDCAEWCYACGKRCNLGDERCTEACLDLSGSLVKEILFETSICEHGYPAWLVSRKNFSSLRTRVITTKSFVQWMIDNRWGKLRRDPSKNRDVFIFHGVS